MDSKSIAGGVQNRRPAHQAPIYDQNISQPFLLVKSLAFSPFLSGEGHSNTGFCISGKPLAIVLFHAEAKYGHTARTDSLIM